MSEEKETAINISDLRPDEPAKDESDKKQDSEMANQAHQPDSKSEENIITDIEQLRNLDDISEAGIEIEASASDLISLFETLEPDPSKTTTKYAGTQNQNDLTQNKIGQPKGAIRKAAPHPGRKSAASSKDGASEDKKRGSLNSSNHPAGSRFDRLNKRRHHNSSSADSLHGDQNPDSQNTNPSITNQILNSDANQMTANQANFKSVQSNQKTDSQLEKEESPTTYHSNADQPDSAKDRTEAISGDISHLSQADQQFYESVMFDQAPPGLRLDKKQKASLPDQPEGFSPTTIINEILVETQEEKQERLASQKAEQSTHFKTTSRKDRRKKSRNWKKKFLSQDTSQNESGQNGLATPADLIQPGAANQTSQSIASPTTLPPGQDAGQEDTGSPSGGTQSIHPADDQDGGSTSQKPARHFVKVKSEDLDTEEPALPLSQDGTEQTEFSAADPSHQTTDGHPTTQARKFVKQREDQPDLSAHSNVEQPDSAAGLENEQQDLTAAAQPDTATEDSAGKQPSQQNNPSRKNRKAKRHPDKEQTNPAFTPPPAAEQAEAMPQEDSTNPDTPTQSGSNPETSLTAGVKTTAQTKDGTNSTKEAANGSNAAGKSNRKSRRRKAKKQNQANANQAQKQSQATPSELADSEDTLDPNRKSLSLNSGPESQATENTADGQTGSEDESEAGESALSKTRADLKAIFTKLTDEMIQEKAEDSEDSSQEQAQADSEKNQAADKKLTFKERFVQFWKRAFKRVGTYALIIAIGAIAYALFKMFQLNLFKLSVVGLFVGICLAGLLLAGFWFFYTRHKLWTIPALALCAAIVAGSLFVEGRVQEISDSLREMSEPADSYVQNIGLYVPSTIPVSDLNALNGETFGIMRNRDETGVNSLLVSLADKGIYVHLKFFSNLQQMYKAVRGQAVRALILDQSDLRLIQTMAGDQTSNQLSLAYSLPVDTGVTTPVSAKNLEKDPFTILISGSSDSIRDSSYRSNLNLLVTVNPSTRQVLTTVLPRSLYIYNDCEEALACQPPDVPDRLSFVSYHSSEALRQTVEHLIESPVDFIVRLNTDKILQLFDIGQTIRFNPYGEYTDLNLHDGNVMTGPQIKQFLGALNDLSDEDLNQELNQLHVLYTLCRSTSLFDSSTFESTMKVLDESVWTSFDYNQLCQLARMFFLFPEHMTESWQIVTGTSSIQYSPTLTEATYMTQPDPETLQNARTAIQSVLDGGSPTVNGLPTRQELTGIPARPAGEQVPFNFINPSESAMPAAPSEETAPEDDPAAQPEEAAIQEDSEAQPEQ